MTKKIISFSLWGDNPKYTVGAIKNALLAQIIYPEWICRFYIGNDVPQHIRNQLDDLNVEIMEMMDMGDSGWNGTFWRFFAADSYDIVICRDTDSRLNLRERVAVDEWLSSDKDFHIMRDHPYHNTEILAGTWGCRNGILRGMEEAIQDYNKGSFDNQYQVDQNFLREVVYPLVKHESIVHDEFFELKPFPANAIKRTGSYFVGQVYDECDTPVF